MARVQRRGNSVEVKVDFFFDNLRTFKTEVLSSLTSHPTWIPTPMCSTVRTFSRTNYLKYGPMARALEYKDWATPSRSMWSFSSTTYGLSRLIFCFPLPPIPYEISYSNVLNPVIHHSHLKKHPVSSSFGCLLIQYILLICLESVLLNGLICYLLLLNRSCNKVKFIDVIFVAVIAL